MANDNNINKKDFDEYHFKVWKSYEKVAMHFNDLIIRLRIQSIGGLAGLAAILGIFLHTQEGSNGSFNCGLAIVAIICLMLLWIAVWILDLHYYNRLLEGSVNAILEIENRKSDFLNKKEINLSSNIERAFKQRFPHEPTGYKRFVNGRNGFYATVLVALVVILVASAIVYCRSYKEKGTCPAGKPDIQNVFRDNNK